MRRDTGGTPASLMLLTLPKRGLCRLEVNCVVKFSYFFVLKTMWETEGDDSRPGPTDNSGKVSDEVLQSSGSFHCTSARRFTKKVRLYNESYLSMGFTWAGRYISVQRQV
jgi:hypothetical protein